MQTPDSHLKIETIAQGAYVNTNEQYWLARKRNNPQQRKRKKQPIRCEKKHKQLDTITTNNGEITTTKDE
jgi:hypothetical protein